MNDFRKQENIDELRKRLYARNVTEPNIKRHTLTETETDVSTDFDVAESSSATAESTVPTDFKPKQKRRYRLFVLVGSLLIFIFGAGLSALYLLIGGNQISSDNIGLTLSGPSAVAGGETMSLQISVSNQNTVPIESATLIINYPVGARAANNGGQELFEERIPINGVAAGEVQNVPIRVVMFGEEGQEKQVTATVEYRIDGSNGTFYKDSTPLNFRITSTPLVLRVENIEKVAAGQMIEMKLVVQSNATNPLTNLLIEAEYPNGFEYEESFPGPVFGENVWRIDELLPEDQIEIVVRGVVSGLTEESFRVNFDAGPAESGNQYRMSSLLTEAWADFTIERPFIDVQVAINGVSEDEVIVPSGGRSQVRVDITNTLDETVYDLMVEVVPGGNALNEDSVSSGSGFYDSNTGSVRWEVPNNPSFAQVFPGSDRNLSFGINPIRDLTTASFDLVVNVYARRIAATNAQEQLIGTNRVVAKFSAEAFAGSQVSRNTASFSDTGPIPPQVGQTTTYTVTLVAEAGANDITDTIVNTSLPLYVNWLDVTEGDGTINYNPISKQMTWQAGSISARENAQISFQVSMTPSISQVNSVPTLVNAQQLRSIDRFTGATLRSSASALTIALSSEAGFDKDDGRVVPAN